MFKTNRNAELLPGFSKSSNGVQYWSFVEQEVIWPWFYLQVVQDDGKETFRSMLMVPTAPLLEQVMAAQPEHAWFEQAQLVTPDYMNKMGRWVMEPLLEVSSIRDVRGNELGYQYRVEGDRVYSTAERQSNDGRLSTHLVFSAALHLRS